MITQNIIKQDYSEAVAKWVAAGGVIKPAVDKHIQEMHKSGKKKKQK